MYNMEKKQFIQPGQSRRPSTSEILPIFLKKKIKELWPLWILAILQIPAALWIVPWVREWQPGISSAGAWVNAEAFTGLYAIIIGGFFYLVGIWLLDNWKEAKAEAVKHYG